MAGGRERADAYHQQFAERIIQALKDGTALWQKPWKPGERIMPHNFGSGRDYRGGKRGVLGHAGARRRLRRPALGRLPPDPGGRRARPQGREGAPIMYVEWRQKRTARDDNGNPVLEDEGRKKLEWVQRDRPIVKLHHVFNVEQTEGLKLRSLAEARRLRLGGLRARGAAGRDRCDDDRQEAQRRTRAAARHGVRQLMDQGTGERQATNPAAARNRERDTGLSR